MRVEGARVVVVGMGRSGIAAAELLVNRGAKVTGVDLNPVAAPQLRALRVQVLPQIENSFATADLIVVSPGVPPDTNVIHRARRRGVPLVGELELASWFLEGDTIGITGSNGKTTTTALVGHILQSCRIPSQVGGNIGIPPTAMVRKSRAGQWNVLELSSFQLESTDSFHARIGVALNVTPDHLDRHYTMEKYAEAKARLFVNQVAGDFAVLNAGDPICRSFATRGKGKAVWFSSSHTVAAPGAFLEGGAIKLDGQTLMQAAEVPLRGMHNLENTLAAAAVARLTGAARSAIRSAIMTFPGVEHRLEFVRDRNGVAWYNDSKATNVDATLKAIAAFAGDLWVILGGKDKGSDYTPLGEPLARKARAALLIGAAADKIESQLHGAMPVIRCETLAGAVAVAGARATTGDTVLLAPACASFDQFDNFEHRGREFKRLVKELPG